MTETRERAARRMMHSQEKVFVIFCTFIYCTCIYTVQGENLQQLSPSSTSSDVCSSICNCDESIYKSVCSKSNLTSIPDTLSPRVKELYINENAITSLRSLNVYKSLEIVSVSSNQLTRLSRDEINNLTRLQIFYVDHNNIEIISSPFTGLPSLIVLNIANNKLTRLQSFTFIGLASLRELDVSNNQIVSLDGDAFTGLTSLKVLSLRNNKLTTLPSCRLQQLTGISATLIKLNLGLNHLKSVTLSHFNCLQSLEELHLDRCYIESLQVTSRDTKESTKLMRSFDDTLRRVTTFNSLRHHHYREQEGEEQLEEEEEEGEEESVNAIPLQSLKLLDLSFNNITMLSGENEKLFRRVECVNLEENFIKCDCSLKWLKDFTVETKMFTRRTAGISASHQLNMIDPFNGSSISSSSSSGSSSSNSRIKVAESAAARETATATAGEGGMRFNCPINHVSSSSSSSSSSSVKCLNVPNNPTVDQVNVWSCEHTSFQLYVSIGSLESSPVFIWFLLLCASSVATLIMIYVKYSIYKPTFPPFYTINRCQRDAHDDTVPFVNHQWSGCTSSSSCTSVASSSSCTFSSSSLSSSCVRQNQLAPVVTHPLIACESDEMSSNKRSPSASNKQTQVAQAQAQAKAQEEEKEQEQLVEGEVHHVVPARVTHVSPYQCTSDSAASTTTATDLSDKTQMLVISSKSTTKTTLLSHTRATDEMV